MPPPPETRSPLLNRILLAFDRRHCRLSAFHDLGALSALLPEQEYQVGSYGATSSAAGSRVWSAWPVAPSWS
jgi:predicted PolB exonuclease-like 3'-5' exonuclease